MLYDYLRSVPGSEHLLSYVFFYVRALFDIDPCWMEPEKDEDWNSSSWLMNSEPLMYFVDPREEHQGVH